MFFVALTDLAGAPLELEAELRSRMQEIATTVAAIPRDHTFWAKTSERELQVDVGGWRFFYRVHPETHRIDVVRGKPLAIF